MARASPGAKHRIIGGGLPREFSGDDTQRGLCGVFAPLAERGESCGYAFPLYRIAFDARSAVEQGKREV